MNCFGQMVFVCALTVRVKNLDDVPAWGKRFEERGTRITVELLLEKLIAGESAEQILRAHPHLPEGSISAALAYALAVIRNDLIVPLERRSA